jgi:sugar phosphate isomerase/epimerase
MRLAFSSNAYMRFSFDEAARRVRSLGYDGLELMADVPHAWPSGLLPATKQAIRTAMNHHALAFSNVNAFMMTAVADHRQPYWHPSFLEDDPAYRRVRIDHTRRALDLCAELGAPHITTEPGGPVAPGTSREEALGRFADVLAPLLDHARSVGVLLLVEPEPDLLLETTSQYLELAARLDNHPALGLNFDIGHAYCMSEDIPAQVARLAAHTRHYHVEDIAASRVHHHLVPGTGAIDFGPIFDAIHGTGYDGWITVELYPFIDDPDAAGRAAFELLSPLVADRSASR